MQWHTDEAKQHWADNHNRVWDIISEVRTLMEVDSESVGWVAAQKSDDEYVGIGFVLGKNYAHISVEDLATKNNGEIAISCFEQLLGYSYGSDEDHERKKAFAQKRIAELKQQIDELLKQRGNWEVYLTTLRQK